MSTPNVPEAAERLRAYYALPGNGQGGVVHLITEDGNVAQHHADWCVWYAEDGKRAGVHGEMDVEIALMLAGMSRTQRNKLSKMSFYPDA